MGEGAVSKGVERRKQNNGRGGGRDDGRGKGIKRARRKGRAQLKGGQEVNGMKERERGRATGEGPPREGTVKFGWGKMSSWEGGVEGGWDEFEEREVVEAE